MEAKGLQLNCVIEIRVADEVLISRIEGRAAETGGSRADDNAETLKKRLIVYHDQTAPLLPYYEGKGVLKVVDGMLSIDEVSAQIREILAEVK